MNAVRWTMSRDDQVRVTVRTEHRLSFLSACDVLAERLHRGDLDVTKLSGKRVREIIADRLYAFGRSAGSDAGAWDGDEIPAAVRRAYGDPDDA